MLHRTLIGLAGGSNLYWVAQNSQMWTDPLGLSAGKSLGTCNDPCKGKNPSKEAQNWQGSGDYPGVDNYQNVVLKKGTVLFSLFPGSPPGYAVKSSTLLKLRNADAFHEALQVQKDSKYGPMRTKVRAYVVTEDICAATGKASANTQFGKGGATQYFIPKDAQHALRASHIVSLSK